MPARPADSDRALRAQSLLARRAGRCLESSIGIVSHLHPGSDRRFPLASQASLHFAVNIIISAISVGLCAPAQAMGLCPGDRLPATQGPVRVSLCATVAHDGPIVWDAGPHRIAARRCISLSNRHSLSPTNPRRPPHGFLLGITAAAGPKPCLAESQSSLSLSCRSCAS